MSQSLATPRSDVVLSCICVEPDGTFEHVVRRMQLTRENMLRFWALARKYKTLFYEDISDDFAKFSKMLVRVGPLGIEPTGLFWVIDDFLGVFYLTEIRPGVDAFVHYTFLDGRSHGREPLARAMLKYAFERYNFRRFSAEIPMYATKSAFIFAEKTGFIYEGRKRAAAPKIGQRELQWFDVKLFGILREEVLNGQ